MIVDDKILSILCLSQYGMRINVILYVSQYLVFIKSLRWVINSFLLISASV